MPFQNIKPIHILWQQTLKIGMLDGITSGIARVLSLAGVSKEFKLEYLAQRRQPDWRDKNGLLNPYKSLDWHIEWARQKSKKPGYLNSSVLIDSLDNNTDHQTEPRYEVVVLNEPIYLQKNPDVSVFGVGRRGAAAVISLADYIELIEPIKRFRFLLATQMLTMHELGHVFGLFPGIGVKNQTEEELKNSHCLNECVMYWCESSELYKKIAHQPFCPSCLEKLRQFFIAP